MELATQPTHKVHTQDIHNNDVTGGSIVEKPKPFSEFQNQHNIDLSSNPTVATQSSTLIHETQATPVSQTQSRSHTHITLPPVSNDTTSYVTEDQTDEDIEEEQSFSAFINYDETEDYGNHNSWSKVKGKGFGAKLKYIGYKTVDSFDYLGGVFAGILGFDGSQHQYVIDAVEQMEYEETEENSAGSQQQIELEKQESNQHFTAQQLRRNQQQHQDYSTQTTAPTAPASSSIAAVYYS